MSNQDFQDNNQNSGTSGFGNNQQGNEYGQPNGQQYPQYGQPSSHPYSDPGQSGGQEYGQSYNQPGQPGYQSQNGAWQGMSPFRLVDEMLTERAKNFVRFALAVGGVAAVILGCALLFWPNKTLAVFALIFGIYFVISGLIRVVSAIVELGLPAGWRVLDIVVGALLTLGGVIVLKNLTVSGQTLAVLATLTVGIGWIMESIITLAESWRAPSSAWAVVYGIISFLAGLVVLFSPISSTVWLILFSGGALLFIGISAIVRAFRFGRKH